MATLIQGGHMGPPRQENCRLIANGYEGRRPRRGPQAPMARYLVILI